MAHVHAPGGLPVLSRGRHRRPARGACFMEMASVLAGERWSDHPACTHPLLGQVARSVNDRTGDERRSELAVLIPSVIGLRGVGAEWYVGLASAVACAAIRVVPQPSQRALAAGLLAAQQVMEAEGMTTVPGTADVAAALADVPGDAAWARALRGHRTVATRDFVRRSAPTMVRCAVDGVVATGRPDVDDLLRRLLEVTIDTATALAAPPPLSPPDGKETPCEHATSSSPSPAR